LYEKDKINMELLISLISKISNKLVKQEFIKVLVLYEYVKNFLPVDCIYFSLSNLYGTGHYSSMNYKIFIRTKSGDIFDIADGGRIDDMVSKFNKVNVLGVCMGIGTTVLSQEIEYEIEDRIMILVEKIDVKIYKNCLELANKLSGYHCSVFEFPYKKIKKFFKHELYSRHHYIIVRLDGSMEYRFSSVALKNKIKSILDS
ncbi:TPA: portal protein, partial [Streptococcus pyogenes]